MKRSPVSSVDNSRTRMIFEESDLLNIPFKYVVYFVGGIPLTSFFLCIFFAVTLHFEATTRTHCHVANYLPSVSAVVGDHSPEKYLWRFAIAIHCLPRFAVSFAYRNFYLTSPLRPSSTLDCPIYWGKCVILGYLHSVEVFSLLGLTYISSIENHALHAVSFTTFVITSLIYMLLTLHIFKLSGRRRNSTSGEKSYQHKLLLCVACFSALFCCLYFYWRHNEFCEPGIYTMFALSEYVVVVTNLLFHATVIYDMGDKCVILSSAPGSEWKAI